MIVLAQPDVGGVGERLRGPGVGDLPPVCGREKAVGASSLQPTARPPAPCPTGSRRIRPRRADLGDHFVMKGYSYAALNVR